MNDLWTVIEAQCLVLIFSELRDRGYRPSAEVEQTIHYFVQQGASEFRRKTGFWPPSAAFTTRVPPHVAVAIDEVLGSTSRLVDALTLVPMHMAGSPPTMLDANLLRAELSALCPLWPFC